jgi:tight adherence protein B
MTPLMQMMIMGAGVLVMLGMVAFAFTGPSVEKAGMRRLDAVKDRHGASTNAIVDAQLRKIRAVQRTKADGFLTTLLPKPELLRKRIAMTGKTWTLSHYVTGSGITAVVVAALMLFKHAPVMLAITLGRRLPDQEAASPVHVEISRCHRTDGAWSAVRASHFGDARHCGNRDRGAGWH